MSLRPIKSNIVECAQILPAGRAETFCTDSFRCRFTAEGAAAMPAVLRLVQRVSEAGIEIAATQTLRNFGGQPGFTLAQGQ
jgi:isocitrate dehydrogenase